MLSVSYSANSVVPILIDFSESVCDRREKRGAPCILSVSA